MFEGADHRDAASLVGRRLGEFVVREPLSSGGFGMVFRAEQQTLAREAVIKVLHTRLRASETLIQRFLREARLASRLDHPFAAHIYAFGAEPDGVLWIAMELVRGTPLDKLLEAQGPITLERFVPLLERICQVVQTAHDQGIVHRDLKPGNVMVLARAGQLLPKLLDLGIAKPSDEDLAPLPAAREVTVPFDQTALVPSNDQAFAETATPAPMHTTKATDPSPTPTPDFAQSGRLTEEGAVMGSPLYMAPEQWMDAATVDARTDIYALGVLSYELLTGKAPFTGANRYQIAMAHAQKEPPKLGGELPVALDAVLAKALAKHPSDRYGSALELAAAFRRASGLADEPTGLPRLPDDVRIAVTARAPQPIAQAASALEAARNPHQARDAVWQLVRVSVRTIALIALAAHAQVGAKRGDLRTADAVRRLRRRALPDAEWLAIARELVLPFAKLREAYPIPELVDFFTGSAAAPLGELLALRDTSDAGATDDAVRALLQSAFPLLERMLASLGFLADYRLVVPGASGAQLWMGVRRSDPALVVLRGRTLEAAQPALVDATGLPVVALWPFVQVHEPARGVGQRLVFLEGTGRRGARMIALPETFEHEDEGLWEVIGGLADDTSQETTSQEASPFPGLAAFTAEDADHFFGRERETEELVNRLRAQPLLAVVGPSGAGKSSFVQAGVIPALPDDWEVVVLRPGAAPLVSLAARIGKLGFDASELAENPGSLGLKLQARGKGTVVIVVDQLEELFTLCQNVQERERFVEALVGAARTVDDPVRVVMTLRDDFLLHAEALPALRARLAPALHLLTTPARDDLLRILTEPLRRAGYELDDPALAGDMVDALAGTRGALALLSFTASKLWELRDRRFRQLSRKAYVSLGGIGGALARHAEATLEAMLPDEQRLVREVFRHAVTAEGTRAVLARADLEQLLGDTRHGPAVIEKLVAARLLVGSEGPTGVEQIEITHEALIQAWPRLVTWRSEDAEGVRLRDQLRTIAKQWQERGRPTGLLWRGDALAEYRVWRSRYPGTLTDLESAFANASLSDAARSQRRRRALLAGSFTVLTVGIIALFVLNRRATDERRAAERSEADAKAKADLLHANLLESYEAQARQYLLIGDYQRSLAFLDEARNLGAQGPAHDLIVAFVASGLTGKLRSFSHAGQVFDAAFSPDVTRLVTASIDHRARIWSLADGRLVAELAHEGPVRTARYTSDGSVLTSSEDGTAVLWNGNTGARLSVFDARGDHVHLYLAIPSPDAQHVVTIASDGALSLWNRSGKLEHRLAMTKTRTELPPYTSPCAFSTDGSRIAFGDRDGTLRVWATSDGTSLGERREHRASINSVAFSRDDTRILSASSDHTAIVWDAAQLQPAIRVHHDAEVLSAMFSPDGKTIATSSNDRTAKLWNARTGDLVFSLDGHLSGVNAIKFSPDGSQLITAGDDTKALLWDVATGRRMSQLVSHRGMIYGAQYAPNSSLVVTISADLSAIVWSAVAQQSVTPLIGHVGGVSAADAAPDHHLVLTGGNDGTLRVWDRKTGQQTSTLPLDGSPVCCATYSPDASLLATGNGHSIQLWNATTRREVLKVSEGAQDIEWSGDGKRIVSVDNDGNAKVWTRDGRLIGQLQHHGAPIISASISTDGETVITTTTERSTQLWRAGGAEIARWNSGTHSARLDPRGELVVAYSALEATISRLDDPDHKPVAQLRSDGLVTDVRWSSHGDFIVTSSIDATIRVWDRAGHLLVILGDGHTHWWQARFSDDDRAIVSTCETGAFVWELPRFIGSFEQLARCKHYQLVGNQLVVATPPADCT